MSRLCLGKSSTDSQILLSGNKPNDIKGKKRVTDKPRSLPVHKLPCSVQVSCQETQKAGSPSGGILNTECAPKEPINITPRVGEQTESTAAPDEELKMKDLRNTQLSDSAEIVEPLPKHEVNEEEEQTEAEVAEDEDLKAPLELIIEFLRAVTDRDFQLARKLCQMILIYEPDNPEASEFLPLIQEKLLEEQEAEQSNEEDEEEEDDSDDVDDEDDDDDDDDCGSDEESSQSSSCSSSSCSSSSPSDDDGEEKKMQVSRHKPCPLSHISP
ncbi:glutamate-rich protein 2 isoform X2 [Xiphias gladius]|uniref:glutamate-rich protein 2 isoform X2 n=1 Tax=Xiphias gladius TaxID=8245 RepID=UPI001A9A1125|nr:glutamate-rich protein 2 isoform X2 [Xiphias gladius]